MKWAQYYIGVIILEWLRACLNYSFSIDDKFQRQYMVSFHAIKENFLISWTYMIVQNVNWAQYYIRVLFSSGY